MDVKWEERKRGSKRARTHLALTFRALSFTLHLPFELVLPRLCALGGVE